MVTVPSGLAAGSAALVVLLATLATTVGLTAAGWGVGVLCGVVTYAAVAGGGAGALGPADLVTVARVTIACAVAGLVADSFVRQPSVPTLVALSVVALLLDAAGNAVTVLRTHHVQCFHDHEGERALPDVVLVFHPYLRWESHKKNTKLLVGKQ